MTAPQYPPQYPPPVRVEGPVQVEGQVQVSKLGELLDDVDAMRRDLAVIAFWFRLLTFLVVAGLALTVVMGAIMLMYGFSRR